MWNAESLSQEQIREFLKSSQTIEFAGCVRQEKYAWLEQVLRAQSYAGLSKRERGVVRAYVEKVTGLSASQVTRLIRRFLDDGAVQIAPYQRHSFQVKCTAEEPMLQLQLLLLRIRSYLKAQTRFHAAQHTDQTVLDLIASRDLLCQRFLVGFA